MKALITLGILSALTPATLFANAERKKAECNHVILIQIYREELENFHQECWSAVIAELHKKNPDLRLGDVELDCGNLVRYPLFEASGGEERHTYRCSFRPN